MAELPFEQKAHYQNLKDRCIGHALAFHQLNASVVEEDEFDEPEVIVTAKRFYNEITDENWDGPQVEGA